MSGDEKWLDQFDNNKTGWYFQPAAKLGEDQPATVPSSVLKLIEPFHVLWQEPEPAGKILYLTFDEGYEYKELSDVVLNVLKEKKVAASFFITGSYLRHNPERVQRMAEDGHLVLNHTDTHPNLVDLLATQGSDAVLEELRLVETAFTELTGRQMPRIIRPPEGSYSERVLALLDRAGYTVAFWSFAYRDWLTDEQPDPQQALDKILGNLHPGSVILLHAVSATNGVILPELIDTARARGYTFELVHE